MSAFVLRNVELDGVLTNVAVKDGRISAIGEIGRNEAPDIDAKGGALLPGLHDHHLHLFATAARLASIDLSDAPTKTEAITRLQRASAQAPEGAWLRAIGFNDNAIGLLQRSDLDAIAHPVRAQDRTGALWVLNTAALQRVSHAPPPQGMERDAGGRPTGRLWREDAWLRQHTKSAPPSLAVMSRDLARRGVTGLTDASVTNGADEAAAFANARASGELLQKITLMSGDTLPPSPFYATGPLKILPDERDLPEVSDIAEKMRTARRANRNVAIHCVTAAELVVALAAFDVAGAREGDRIEHGGVIPEAFFEQIRALNLIVVTQPNFIRDRGDRYLATISPEERDDLYRLGSLQRAGIRVAAGSDAPYGGHDPWSAIATAMTRTTQGGAMLGRDERISARAALDLYLTPAANPGQTAGKVAIGAAADLCLLASPLADALAAPTDVCVAATFVDGVLIHAS